MKKVGNQKGIALLMAMVTTTLLIYIASEVAFESTVEYSSTLSR
jgi:type II secretory pathway component PulK